MLSPSGGSLRSRCRQKDLYSFKQRDARCLAFHTLGMVVAVPFSRRTTYEAGLQREGFDTNSGNQRLQPVGQVHQAHALRGLRTVKGITDGHPA